MATTHLLSVRWWLMQRQDLVSPTWPLYTRSISLKSECNVGQNQEEEEEGLPRVCFCANGAKAANTTGRGQASLLSNWKKRRVLQRRCKTKTVSPCNVCFWIRTHTHPSYRHLSSSFISARRMEKHAVDRERERESPKRSPLLELFGGFPID